MVVNVCLPDRSDVVAFLDEEVARVGATAVEVVMMGRILKRMG
ncbi:hypothetical protein [Brachybacterium sillae]|nr:hypothetical protein [Brachybacterium sillae]